MDKHGLYLQLYARAPAPLRDYYGLTITESQVILNVWNITHGPHVFPKRYTCELEHFSESRALVLEIEMLFGVHIVNYCKSLSRKDKKLECLPTKLFLYMLRFLATRDILRLGQSSKLFFELCNRDLAWKIIYRKVQRKKPTRFELSDAKESGWRALLKSKSNRKERKGSAVKTVNLLKREEPKKVYPKKTESPIPTPRNPQILNNVKKRDEIKANVIKTHKDIKHFLVNNLKIEEDKMVKIEPSRARTKPKKDETNKIINIEKTISTEGIDSKSSDRELNSWLMKSRSTTSNLINKFRDEFDRVEKNLHLEGFKSVEKVANSRKSGPSDTKKSVRFK